MTAYATVEDLQARMKRPLGPTEIDHAETLLAEASSEIDARFRVRGWSVESRLGAGLLTEDDLRAVVCRMVRRALLGDDSMEGVRTLQQVTGPFSDMVTYANPMGDLYLSKADLLRLGLAGQCVGGLDMFPIMDGS